ncbi:hypothetical protein GCM10009863_18640 [Streptomyces axinellae]|uniref:Uncharacterized protein n=1 Tax=Streptomyces axinellae TaxID=552788 RepID=A0ABN3PYC9_9ACTN
MDSTVVHENTVQRRVKPMAKLTEEQKRQRAANVLCARPSMAKRTGEPENREPRKHAQVRWVDAAAIPEEFVDTTASALYSYLEGGPEVSLNGWR